jgi:hypothetical protein
MSYSWLINWRNIFPDKNQETCKVQCKIISNTNNSITTGGTVRCSLPSNTNGFILGTLQVKNLEFDTNQNYWYLNTSENEEGISMMIPREDISNFQVQFLDFNEQQIAVNTNFQVWLYFSD